MSVICSNIEMIGLPPSERWLPNLWILYTHTNLEQTTNVANNKKI